MNKVELIHTQQSIKYLKDTFEKKLKKKLNLVRVSAPLFVSAKSGLNDELSGKEKCVSFKYKDEDVEIVHSLAKWKRYALKQYNFHVGEGLYTDMNAIRKDEEVDNIHSIYVDQWDWEKIINKKDRNLDTLFEVVSSIYSVIYNLKKTLERKWKVKYDLPSNIHFISTKEIEEKYPTLSNKEREYEICKQYKAVFVYQIGYKMKDGLPFGERASDYDDWGLNGDILLYDDVLDIALEISSMGIRVDKESLLKQLKEKDEMHKIDKPYIQMVLNEQLPYTIGGGIGQSRLCLYFLKKRHIGEVQASYWPDDYKEQLIKEGYQIL